MLEAVDLRAKVLGLEAQSCEVIDEFHCWQKEGHQNSYISGNKVNENIQDFCDSVVQPSNTLGWKYEKTYFKGSVDEHTFVLQLDDKTADWSKPDCLEAFGRIVNGCDGNDPENPMDWKFGGSWRKSQL